MGCRALLPRRLGRCGASSSSSTFRYGMNRVVPLAHGRPLHGATASLHDNPLGLPPQSQAAASRDQSEVLQRVRAQLAARDATAPAAGAAPRPAGTIAAARGLPVRRPIPGVEHLLVVASGKGGVGKSTTTVNLAIGLRDLGLRVGVLDADLFGPSIPTLLGLQHVGKPLLHPETGHLVPLENHGLSCMSMGFLVPPSAAVVWRGLMVMKALEQLLRQVAWGPLDVLLVDMPPGTGDTQLTISQQLPLAGAIIVSTPQDLSLVDARKGIDMFHQVGVPIVGLVQNMAMHICPKCSHTSHIFGKQGVERAAQELGLDVLASVPLHPDVCSTSDSGQPIALKPGPFGTLYGDMARQVMRRLGSRTSGAGQGAADPSTGPLRRRQG